MDCLGRWASFPALDLVDPDSHSCNRIAANTKDGTLLKDLKNGFVRNKHTNGEYLTCCRNCSGKSCQFKNKNIEAMVTPIFQQSLW
jgi:hypothetical protein